ncbi:hypothetical protein R84981_001560 [Carnimonas sp. R-84981]|uniref:PepSY domain-containing protein n=1 Tax=Carnimonas bestiolae TaxID=3402172 RepID=UPI003EDBFC7A
MAISRLWIWAALSLLACAWLSLTAPYASSHECKRKEIDHEEALQLTASGAILPLERVIGIAQVTHPGKMLEASLERYHHRYVYSIEILDEQDQVWDLLIDAVSGKRINP